MKKEIMRIDVSITGVEKVEGKNNDALMIFFTGNATGEFFTGEVIPGGIDTQVKKAGSPRSLSARYMLKGKDYTGMDCRIFIENNGIIDENEKDILTTPMIITDSENLSWLESASLEGKVCPSEEGVKVYIYST